METRRERRSVHHAKTGRGSGPRRCVSSCGGERPGVLRRGWSVAVRGQERGQRRQHRLGSLLGDEVAGAGNDQALHIVRGELHRVPDPLTGACRSADRQDGQGQPPGLALRVLRQWVSREMTPRRTLSRRTGYALAAGIVGLALFASGPSPLYGFYREPWGFSPLVLTLVYATYAFGVLTTLILAGRLSDDVGRRAWRRARPSARPVPRSSSSIRGATPSASASPTASRAPPARALASSSRRRWSSCCRRHVSCPSSR
jgi:hypothetical protein